MVDNVIGKLIYKITGDTSALDTSVKKTDKEVKGLGKSLTNLGKLIKGSVVAGAIAFGAKKMYDMGKALVSVASDAEETDNKFNVVFGHIKGDAAEAADSLAENFGLSSLASKQLLSDTGDLLTGFGFTESSALDLSTQVNELAVDLASFTNFAGGSKGASEALTKALLGERESVKALGISIQEADVKAKILQLTQEGMTFATERQAKAVATLKIAQEQSKNAQGDFARSIDSYANQTRIAAAETENLKVALGKSFIPTATSAVTLYAKLTGKLADYIEKQNEIKDILKEVNTTGVVTTTNAERLTQALDKQKKILEATEDAYYAEISALAGQKEYIDQATERYKENRAAVERSIETIYNQIKAIKQQEYYSARYGAELEANAARNARLALELEKASEAADLLNQRQKERLTDDENQLQAVQALINKYWEFKDVAEVQELLNDLIAERTEIQNRVTDATKQEKAERLQAIQEEIAAEQAKRDEQERIDKEYYDSLKEMVKEHQSAEAKAAEETTQLIEESYNNILNVGATVIGSLSNLWSMYTDNMVTMIDNQLQAQLSALDEQLEAELEANGLAEESTLEKLERQLAEAIAAGDTETAEELQDEIDRQTIIEEYDKKKAEAEKKAALKTYEYELAAFETAKALNTAEAVISGLSGAVSAYKSLAGIPYVGPALGIAAAAAVSGFAAAQVALIQSEPPPPAPTFQNGGIVPGTSYSGDNVQANVNSGEMILNAQQQAQLFALANGGGAAPTRVTVYLGKKVLLDTVSNATKTGELIVHARAVK